ncbi:hypothetical protein Mnod_8260 (plasmid) [Methylobacterium nodulans ORS 2060]|uniref:Uncharacterized protein n=1 Tax=Methylobacterium nodulans (strain LMG 21967 / CNCM I-2342 / ORS 2060) TaxID=460265 RepID=B8IVH4_METNO|nr:hypothetical protein Mnod_8260 [Methylobacterium nodulans ORS 2060]
MRIAQQATLAFLFFQFATIRYAAWKMPRGEASGA